MESFEDVRKEQRYVSHVDQPPGVKVENMLLATMHSALLVTIGIVQAGLLPSCSRSSILARFVSLYARDVMLHCVFVRAEARA